MRTLDYSFDADAAVVRAAHVGVVASGDLEIVVDTASPADTATVRVRTSVDGFDSAWQAVLERFFAQQPLAGRWEINDFGATPGVVALRLRQAAQLATAGESK
ncbi:malonate decarboxylase acyl carrier protein [Mycobacterium sp. 852002-51057_SCH5723018]|uniref:malonate decarboxylase acyl carrier protein n=1 Tax=Mycobacterium sp. 852002-51057_SCH5723018 TaxID=1834094 RepID=UPI0008014047|nr:malonate decarboxylase acyl carrier protein [Mycobacterium sp. 852002-51057_SCH5723018]OBG19714.1 malonate decarboxylase acyl carrier protein [Mycobacterium sp. 852002-51057_SCH5723018]